MKIFLSILKILGFSLIMLIVYYLVNYLILRKIKVKHKWIVLVLGLLIVFSEGFLNIDFYSIVGTCLSGLSIIMLLWYMELKGLMKAAPSDESENGTGSNIKYVDPRGKQANKNNKKKEVIKPKSKPNKAMKNDKQK